MSGLFFNNLLGEYNSLNPTSKFYNLDTLSSYVFLFFSKQGLKCLVSYRNLPCKTITFLSKVVFLKMQYTLKPLPLHQGIAIQITYNNNYCYTKLVLCHKIYDVLFPQHFKSWKPFQDSPGRFNIEYLSLPCPTLSLLPDKLTPGSTAATLMTASSWQREYCLNSVTGDWPADWSWCSS